MTVSRKKFGGLTVAKHPPTRNYMMSDDAIEYPLYSSYSFKPLMLSMNTLFYLSIGVREVDFCKLCN